MSLEISVRGHAQRQFVAERALVSLAASFEGPDKAEVFKDAVSVADPLAKELREMAASGAVASWSADKLRVYGHRPWGPEGRRSSIVQEARVGVKVEFVDFETMSQWLDEWSRRDGFVVDSVAWDVTTRNRRRYEAEVRRSAVEDAVSKAQAYADAVGHAKVVAVQLADPGMLHVSAGGPEPFVAMASAAHDEGAGPELVMTPEDIEISIEVDARFTAS